MARISVRIDTHQIIYDDDTYSPHVGLDAQDSPYQFEPWKWDDRLWGSAQYENLDFTVANLWDPSTSVLSDSFFQSGVGNASLDLETLKVFKARKESRDNWAVKARHGTFFKYDRYRYMFAQRSHVQHVDNTANEVDVASGTHNVIQLDYPPRDSGTITATMWRRNEVNEPEAHKFIQKVEDFTGTWTAGVQNDTRTSATYDTDWQYVDTSKREFTIEDEHSDPPKAIFNKDHTLLVGKVSPSHADQIELMEEIGVSDGTDDQIFQTKFFPILDNSELVLYEGDTSTARTRELIPTGSHYYGMQMGHVFDVNGPSTSGNYFYIDFDRGEITFPDGTAPAINTRLYISYRATVELEYEPNYKEGDPPDESEINNNFVTSEEQHLELNPMRTSLNRGFIYVSEQDSRVASLELTVERKSLISGTTYGPVYIGMDYCLLVATALNAFGDPVPGIEVTFSFPNYSLGQDLGRVNGLYNDALGLTDASGEARVIYTPPRSVEALGAYVDYNGSPSDILTLPSSLRPSDVNLEEVYTFRVLSGDTWLPYDASAANRGGRKVIEYTLDSAKIHPRLGTTGAYSPLEPFNYTPSTGELQYPTGSLISSGIPIFGSSLVNRCYWVTVDKDTTAQASCWSNLYNKEIDSNTIDLRLSLPEYRKGKYVADGIGTIPYGFRFYDDYLSAASGLDGATFLSINPAVGMFPILWPNETGGTMDLTGEFESTNPFTGTLGHKFMIPYPAVLGHTFTII